jgi:PLAT/LH2 domain
MFRHLSRIATAMATIAAIIGLAALPAAQPPASDRSTAAAAAAVKAAPVTQAVRRYQIITQTAWDSWAGTDATVRIKVYGFAAESPGYVNLDNSDDNFEPGKTDVFDNFQWNDLGGVDFIGVYKGNNGSDWKLLYVDVRDTITGITYHCPTNTDPAWATTRTRPPRTG